MSNITTLYGLLRLRKDKRYRRGLLQGAASFGVISQRQWEWLYAQVQAGVVEPRLPNREQEAGASP